MGINKSIAEFGKASQHTRNLDGEEIENLEERKSAEFGDISALNKTGSQEEFYNRSRAELGDVSNKDRMFDGRSTEKILNATPMMDRDGHSDESDEGIVADHKPFDGIR